MVGAVQRGRFGAVWGWRVGEGAGGMPAWAQAAACLHACMHACGLLAHASFGAGATAHPAGPWLPVPGRCTMPA